MHPGAGIHIPGHAAGGLAGHQVPTIGRLGHILVAGRQIGDQIGALQRQSTAGRLRHPQVLAQLHTQQYAAAQVKQLTAHGHAVHHLYRIEIRAGGEPALFVKLIIIGQMHLGHHALHLPVPEQ